MKLNELLRKHGFTFSKKYGQNFISDDNILYAIAEKGGVTKADPVLEIGCGAGTLTKVLCEKSQFVYGYEIDKSLAPVLGENLAGIDNCEITFRDIMKEDLAAEEKRIGKPYMLVANLPYYITSPVIMKFIENSLLCKSIVVMVQEEVALRICADPGTPEYGAITAGIGRVANAERIMDVGRNNFYPVPNVDSAVVKIVFDRTKFEGVDAKVYRDLVRVAFSSRRKTLANNLKEWLKIDRDSVCALLNGCGIDEMARGETLSCEDFARLTNAVCRDFSGVIKKSK